MDAEVAADLDDSLLKLGFCDVSTEGDLVVVWIVTEGVVDREIPLLKVGCSMVEWVGEV